MNDLFFEQPLLNAPYKYPSRHREPDDHGQPTQKILDYRRPAKFISPIPKPASGRIAVKVINHLGDEVMKVFKVRD